MEKYKVFHDNVNAYYIVIGERLYYYNTAHDHIMASTYSNLKQESAVMKMLFDNCFEETSILNAPLKVRRFVLNTHGGGNPGGRNNEM